MAAFRDHFSTGSADYATHRPTYPCALVDFLADAAPGRDVALDACCGTGQLATRLAARFARVVATDASAAQIGSAVPHERVTYRVAPAERSGLADGSADLVAVAQAAHWLDLDPFYDEVRRIARRPGAVVALVSYGVMQLADPAAETVVQRFYRDALGPYWPPERRHVEDGYRSLQFPFTPVEAPALSMEAAWDLRALLGYVETWSAVRAAGAAVGRASIEAFRADLARAWGDPELARGVRWPLSLRVGRVD